MLKHRSFGRAEGQVFLQQDYWPDFGGKGSVLELHGLSWVQTTHTPLAIY